MPIRNLNNTATINQQFGHYSEQTGLMVTKFPLYYGKYTILKIWAELSAGGKKQKYMTQLWNPDTNTWNKPKHNGLNDLVVLALNADPYSAQCGLPEPQIFNFANLTRDEILTIANTFVFDEVQRTIITAKLKDFAEAGKPPEPPVRWQESTDPEFLNSNLRITSGQVSANKPMLAQKTKIWRLLPESLIKGVRYDSATDCVDAYERDITVDGVQRKLTDLVMELRRTTFHRLHAIYDNLYDLPNLTTLIAIHRDQLLQIATAVEQVTKTRPAIPEPSLTTQSTPTIPTTAIPIAIATTETISIPKRNPWDPDPSITSQTTTSNFYPSITGGDLGSDLDKETSD
jgi:hypothetical protein